MRSVKAALLDGLPAHLEAHVLPGTHEELSLRLLGFEVDAEGGRVVPQLFPEERRFLDRVLTPRPN